MSNAASVGCVPTIREIQEHVGRLWRVPVLDIVSRRRDAPTVRARHAAMWLARHVTLHSLPEIGRSFGNRDHTSVGHAIRCIDAALAADAGLASELWALVDWYNSGDSVEIRRASFRVVA